MNKRQSFNSAAVFSTRGEIVSFICMTDYGQPGEREKEKRERQSNRRREGESQAVARNKEREEIARNLSDA